MRCLDAPGCPCFIKGLEPLVSKSYNHGESVSCGVTGCNLSWTMISFEMQNSSRQLNSQ